MPYPHPYLELYNASARAIKSVHETLKVGGPATAGLEFVQEFVNDTKAMGIPVRAAATPQPIVTPPVGICG
jgi:xylan 1,4-beta-xylosidase